LCHESAAKCRTNRCPSGGSEEVRCGEEGKGRVEEKGGAKGSGSGETKPQTKQGRVEEKGGAKGSGQGGNFILSGLSKSEARSFVYGMGLNQIQLTAVNSSIKRITSASVSKITQNGSDVVIQIFRQGHDGYQVVETTVRINGSKTIIQKAYNSSGKLVHHHPK